MPFYVLTFSKLDRLFYFDAHVHQKSQASPLLVRQGEKQMEATTRTRSQYGDGLNVLGP